MTFQSRIFRFLPAFVVSGFSLLIPAIVIVLFVTRPRQITSPLLLIMLLILAQAISLALAFGSEYSRGREISTLYNLYVWSAALSFFHYGTISGRTDGSNWQKSTELYKGARVAFYCSVAAYLGAFIFVSINDLPNGLQVSTALGTIITGDLPGILRFYTQLEIGRSDWILEQRSLRFNGLGIYPNEGAIILVTTGYIYLALKVLHSPLSMRYIILWESVIFFCLVLSASRTMVLGFLFALLITRLTPAYIRSKHVNFSFLVGTFRIILLIFSLLLISLIIGEVFQIFNEIRGGSSNVRLSSYKLAFQMVIDESILFGLGVKPVDNALFKIAIGSHSSFISLFTKGGVLAVTLFVVFIFLVMRRQFFKILVGVARENQNFERIVLRGTIIVFVWLSFEDLDAGVVGACCLFTFLGFIYSVRCP